MDEKANSVFTSAINSQAQAADLLKQLFVVARPTSVYSEPHTAGDHTVIMASEVSVGLGFGFGVGGGSGQAPSGNTAPEENAEVSEESGGGGGGGGGGGAFARPVAVIVVRPDRVTVEPVVDPTKIALAFFAMLGSIWMVRRRMRRMMRRLR